MYELLGFKATIFGRSHKQTGGCHGFRYACSRPWPERLSYDQMDPDDETANLLLRYSVSVESGASLSSYFPFLFE